MAAPVDTVWRCLTDPSMLVQWLGEAATAEPVAAGSRLVVDHGDGYLCSSTVLEVDPGALLAITWKFPDEPETAVTVRLAAEDGGCRLLLSHAGLGELTESYAVGWLVHLSYLEAAALGAPLPTSQFWNLHSTMVQLTSAPRPAGEH